MDTLQFQGMATYKDRLKKYQDATGLTDAVLSGHGMIEGYKVAIAVMDFSFLAATMGSVVGERITRTIEYGTANRCAVIIVSASGGARMYEGMLSLMQMAKTSGALARHACERLPYISVLTNPTTAGVMASFASLGDVIIAEPKSMIGFAGPRVIKETTHQDLPERFQTAEFLEEHGLIDLIVHRKRMRAADRRVPQLFFHDRVNVEGPRPRPSLPGSARLALRHPAFRDQARARERPAPPARAERSREKISASFMSPARTAKAPSAR